MKQLLEDKWVDHFMTLKVRCSPDLETLPHWTAFARLLPGLREDAFDQPPGTCQWSHTTPLQGQARAEPFAQTAEFTIKQSRRLSSLASIREHASVSINIALYSINMLTGKKGTKGRQISEYFLTTSTWSLLDTVAGRHSLYQDGEISAVRPELVIVSTLQQLLQAEKDQRVCAYITLERIGKTIHYAATKGSPRLWFDPKIWMYAVLLSADPPPHDIQASCLYNVEKLDQLRHLINKAPQYEDTAIPFFQCLLQVSRFSALA